MRPPPPPSPRRSPRRLASLAALLLAAACQTPAPPPNTDLQILPATALKWEQLNPARGDQSPQAATLWGDRQAAVPTAFLAKFTDGFASPPHVHNVSYRAIVIAGQIHNAPPTAAKNWMPPGSHWTQPAGQPHITAAQGPQNLALVEIDAGPYQVLPLAQKFNNGELPQNTPATATAWKQANTKSFFRTAPLWNSPQDQTTGTLIQFPKNLRITSPAARLVLIAGQLTPKSHPQPLTPGSLLTLAQKPATLHCTSSAACTIYLRATADFTIESCTSPTACLMYSRPTADSPID